MKGKKRADHLVYWIKYLGVEDDVREVNSSFAASCVPSVQSAHLALEGEIIVEMLQPLHGRRSGGSLQLRRPLACEVTVNSRAATGQGPKHRGLSVSSLTDTQWLRWPAAPSSTPNPSPSWHQPCLLSIHFHLNVWSLVDLLSIFLFCFPWRFFSTLAGSLVGVHSF